MIKSAKAPARRKRESWATRPLPPLTMAELDRHMELMGELMSAAGDKAHLYLPTFGWLKQIRSEFSHLEEAVATAKAKRAIAGVALDMKRAHETWKDEPVTLAKVDAAFTRVAQRMQTAKQPELYVPIWRALERERDRLLETERIFREARERASNTKA